MECFVAVLGQMLGIAEIIIVVDFLVKCFGFRTSVKGSKIKVLLLCVVMLFVAQGNGRFQHSHVAVVFVDIILLFIFCRLYLNGSVQLQILGCFLPFLVIAAINTMIMQIFAFLRYEAVTHYMSRMDLYLILGALLSKLILWGVLRWIRLVWKNILHLSKQYYFVVNLLILLCVGIEILLFYVVDSGIYDRATSRMLIVISIGMIFAGIYMGYSTARISKQDLKLRRYELLQLKNKEKEQQIEAYGQMNFRMRQFQHDYQNHCMNMQKLLYDKQYEELDLYLRDLTGRYMDQSYDYINTGNTLIDTVINNKIFQGRNAGIHMACAVVGDWSDVKGLEMGVILFNLLDNAIEANQKVTGDKKIELKLSMEKETLDITVKNTIIESVLTENQCLRTDKKEKEMHGIGHMAVEEMVEELGGIIEYYEEDLIFCAHVFVP